MSNDMCPMCKKKSTEEYKPFCTKRCSDIDMGCWLKGGYSIPGHDGEANIPANDNPDADPELK